MERPDKTKKLNITPDDVPEENIKVTKLNIDLSEEDNAEPLSVDLDSSSEAAEANNPGAGDREVTGANQGNSCILEIDDLPDFNEQNRIYVDVSNSSPQTNILQMNSCPGCGGIIDPEHGLCRECTSRLQSSPDPEAAASSPRKMSIFVAAAFVFVFAAVGVISLLVYEQDTQPYIPEPEPTPAPEPAPEPDPEPFNLGDYANLQEVIDHANDGDVITLADKVHYGPLDFKGKNLTLRPAKTTNPGDENSEVVEVAVAGAVISLVNTQEIDSLFKGYSISQGRDGKYKEFTYRAETNYFSHNEFPGTYLKLVVKDDRLVVSGQTAAAGRSIRIRIDSGIFKGQYKTVSGTNHYFEIAVPPQGSQEGMRMETVKLDVQQGDSNRGTFRRFYTNLIANLYFGQEGLKKVELAPSLAYDGNARAWNTYREPSNYLGATSRIQSENPKILEKADSLVEPGMSDYKKLVVIHDWVTTNIAYDAHYRKTGERAPQDAVSVLEQKVAVCAGYTNIMAALLRSQGIAARYVSGYALGSHDTGRGWEEEGLYNHSVGHAWNEVYIDGEWITIDSTWNSGYINISSGKFVFDQSFRYFAPSVEFFSRSHFIPVNR